MSEQPPNEAAAPVPPKNRPARIGNFRSSVAQFLAALILMLAVAPFVEELEYGPVIDRMLITLVLILGVLAVGRSHRTLVLAVVLMVPAVVAGWISHFQPQLLPPAVHNIGALVFLGFVEYQMLHFIFRAPRVNSEVLCAGISGYLLLGILWMSAYMLVSRLNPVDPAHPELNPFAFTVGATAPHSLSQFEAYYFSFITLSTVGYGDITPLTNGARTLAMMEAMTGTLYMAVLISRLVALYSSQNPESSERKD
ncbi:MAG: potassium channel family protein [Verrucomicrobiales bacterium]|nr:potassium channel family protein [Verrucomicrobiales bacterium]